MVVFCFINFGWLAVSCFQSITRLGGRAEGGRAVPRRQQLADHFNIWEWEQQQEMGTHFRPGCRDQPSCRGGPCKYYLWYLPHLNTGYWSLTAFKCNTANHNDSLQLAFLDEFYDDFYLFLQSLPQSYTEPRPWLCWHHNTTPDHQSSCNQAQVAGGWAADIRYSRQWVDHIN